MRAVPMNHALGQFDTPEPRSGRTASAEPRAAGLEQIVLVEDQADHAELIVETLESAFPGVPVLRPERGDVVSGQPGALLLSLDSSLARVRSLLSGPAQRLPLILLVGESARWTLQDLPAPTHPVARLDKRDGHRFLQRLPETITESVQQAARALPRASEPPGATVHVPPAARNAPHDGLAEAPPDQRATEAATGLLLGALERVLANMTPIAGLVRSRFPGDAAANRYASSLEDELARARAVARRLSAVAGPERAPLVRRMNLGQLVGLRAAAWTMLVPPGVEIEVTSDERTPDVEIVPDVLGTVLDDLLQAVVPCASAPARLRVQAKGAALDGGLASEPAGLKRGRYARLTLEVERTTQRAAGAVVVAGRKLERALAVVKAHGGYLELRQDPGAPAPCAADVFLPAAASRPAAATGRARTVLLVDDDAGVRQVTLEMLKTIGIEPTAASSGEEALELYRAGCRYDLVLLDLSMGAGMSGRAAYGELKQIDPEAAVLLVSGSVTAPTLRALLERGLLGFLPKPFGMRQLVSAVQAALGS